MIVLASTSTYVQYFIDSVAYGILFPLPGLSDPRLNASGTTNVLDTAQTIRGLVGIKF